MPSRSAFEGCVSSRGVIGMHGADKQAVSWGLGLGVETKQPENLVGPANLASGDVPDETAKGALALRLRPVRALSDERLFECLRSVMSSPKACRMMTSPWALQMARLVQRCQRIALPSIT